MLGQVTVDMGTFMYLQAAAVLCMAFALMLLRPDAEEFTSFGSSIFTTYALLMFADGVGAHDLYQGPCLAPHAPPCGFPHAHAHAHTHVHVLESLLGSTPAP